MNEVHPKPEEPKVDEVESVIGRLASFKKDMDQMQDQIKKKDETIDKLIEFHKKEVTRAKEQYDGEMAKIKIALKNALINDYE